MIHQSIKYSPEAGGFGSSLDPVRALFQYERHLREELTSKGNLHADDVLTLIRMCRDTFAPDQMRRELSNITYGMVQGFLGKVEPSRQEEVAQAIATLSDHPSWRQTMVELGLGSGISGPNRFERYEDFEDAIKSLIDGTWTFSAGQLCSIIETNPSFLEQLGRDNPGLAREAQRLIIESRSSEEHGRDMGEAITRWLQGLDSE